MRRTRRSTTWRPRHAGDTSLLCLAGPSGIGKTAFARALASALGRRLVRVSLAGAGDPAAVHGVARPAAAAAPGRLVDALRRLGPLPGHAGDNPLVLLGDLDQLGEAAADALLRVLDPVGDHAFRDRYVGLPMDLTGVLFVAAASDRGRIPPLLLERPEVLPLAGYADAEKERNRRPPSGPPASGEARAVGRPAVARRAPPRRLHRDGLPPGGAPAFGRPPPARGDGAGGGGGVARGAPRLRGGELAGRTRRAGAAPGLAVTREGGGVLLVEAALLPAAADCASPGRSGRS